MANTINRRVSSALLLTGAVCFLSLSILSIVSVRTVQERSRDYIRSISARISERVTILLREKVKSLEGIGEHLRYQYSDAYLSYTLEPYQYEKELVEMFTQYQYGVDYDSFRILDHNANTRLYFERGFLRDSNEILPDYLLNVIRNLDVGEYAIVTRQDKPSSFYLIYSPHYMTSELRAAPGDVVSRARKYLAVEYDSGLLKRYIDDVVFSEESRNNILWHVGFYRNSLPLWRFTDNDLPDSSATIKEDLSTVSVGNRTYYSSIVGIPESDWDVVALVPRWPIFKPILGLYAVGVILLCASIAVMILSINYLGRKISEPISHLIEATKSLADGNYDLTLEKHSDDEIGLLARSFDEMAVRLRAYQINIRETAAMAAIGRLSSQIAHDIRSPLSVLRSYIKMTQNANATPEDAAEFGPAAERSVAKLLNMAEDLLDYSKSQQANRNTFAIDGLVREVLNEVAAEARQNNISVSYESSGGAHLNLDQAKINRVLTNIALNGIQAHTGSGYVMIRCGIEGVNAVISVSDTGCGIPPDKFDIIFDRSFTFGKPKGTGLGLAYCKEVVQAHGGSIEVESEVGKGSTFRITLPACVVKPAAETANTAEFVDTTTRPPATRPQRILIADDEADIRAQWKKIIDERGGTVVYSASSAEEIHNHAGLDYAAIDTAIVDYEYRGFKLTGVDLIRFLRSKGVKNIHLCTGFAGDQEIRRRAEEAGASSVVGKPIDATEVSKIFS